VNEAEKIAKFLNLNDCGDPYHFDVIRKNQQSKWRDYECIFYSSIYLSVALKSSHNWLNEFIFILLEMFYEPQYSLVTPSQLINRDLSAAIARSHIGGSSTGNFVLFL